MFMKEKLVGINLFALSILVLWSDAQLPSSPCKTTVSLPLWSKVLWAKVPDIILIRMANGGYMKKAFCKGNSKHWT